MTNIYIWNKFLGETQKMLNVESNSLFCLSAYNKIKKINYAKKYKIRMFDGLSFAEFPFDYIIFSFDFSLEDTKFD